MLFENSHTDQQIRDELDEINSSLKAEEEFSYSIEEIDEEIEQKREQISKIDSAYTRGKRVFIVCIILALIFVCISYRDVESFFDRTPDPVCLVPPVQKEEVLMDVFAISLPLLISFIFLLKRVDGGVLPIISFGVAMVFECLAGVDLTFRTVVLVMSPVACFLCFLDEYFDDWKKWATVMACALIIYFSDDKRPVNSFDLWSYVIIAFGVTIFAAWIYKITHDKEGDRLRGVICDYEKEIKEKKTILAKKARLEEELRAREEQIAEMYEEGSDPEWETPAFQPEEELSDEEKLKRAIDRFRIPSPQAEDEFFSPFGG